MQAIPVPLTPQQLAATISQCMARDQHRLRRQLDRFKSLRDPAQSGAALIKLQGDIERSQAERAARQARLPALTYPEELPVSEKREDIARAIAAHQVTIVCGETGSGKTTQLPKICLELGCGIGGLIGCTQPRRIAARTVASRVAFELKSPLGEAVGYKVRFNDKVSADNYIKVMTDGILLAETQGDRYLSAYDTIIIDEAHERSLNIDFLLGFMKLLLPKRPDLKLVITSATIDADRFSRHFGGAPVIEVSGRTYPVEMRYRPIRSEDEDNQERDLEQAILDATDELARLSRDGDILIFLPGEREIRDTAEALRKHHPPHTEILPLFARQSVQEQERVFKPSGARRIVLATNVAETSLTVPGIRYVIDPGYARIKRYGYRNKVDQLLVEKISQASANQRAGRCGRVAAGVCIRLYGDDDYKARPAFTDPEILRTSLAGTILRMQALKLGEVEDFPFLEAPTPRMIADGYQLLAELGAVDAERKLTETGRRLAQLPVDPKIGRMLLAGQSENCLTEVLAITSALAVPDPRLRPMEAQGSADDRHRKFQDERSDFMAFLKLWAFFDDALKHKKSNRKLLDQCHENFLSYVRMREWREIHGQLHTLVTEMGMRPNQVPAGYDEIHRALLTGLLGNIGVKADEGHFQGAREIKFQIFPGSTLFKKSPKWVMAAEITETQKLYARTVAKIEPEWVEKVGAHLIKRSYFDPHWEKGPAMVAAFERTTLHGLIINPKRRVHYGPIDPKMSREIFIRAALVEGQYETRVPFFEHNRKLVEEIQELEHKSRRQDVLVDELRMYAFFDTRLPADIHNGAAFDKWRREAERENPRLLFMSRDDLMRHGAEDVTEELFPETTLVGETPCPLTYRFDPSHPLDGVTLTLPLHLLNQIDEARCQWLVPGMIRDKVTWLVKALPKQIRRVCVPVPEFVTDALTHISPAPPKGTSANSTAPEKSSLPFKGRAGVGMGPNSTGTHPKPHPEPPRFALPHEGEEQVVLRTTRGEGASLALTTALSNFIQKKLATEVPPDAWNEADLLPHFKMNFRVVDDAGEELAFSRDLAALKKQLGQAAQVTFARAPELDFERENITAWDFGDLPEKITFNRSNTQLVGYPALADENGTVAIRLFDTPDVAHNTMRGGVCRLLRLCMREQIKQLEKNLPGFTQTALQARAITGPDDLREDLLSAIADRAFIGDDELPRTEKEFTKQRDRARTRLAAVADGACRTLASIFSEYHSIQAKLGTKLPAPLATDIREQLEHLVYKGFLSATPWEQLQQLPRYLKGILRRIEKYPGSVERDTRSSAAVRELWQNYKARVDKHRKSGISDPKLADFRWMIEELRISLFAQELKTPYPVSVKRLQKVWSEIKP
jgi:ATP-dependent helicase HrpA